MAPAPVVGSAAHRRGLFRPGNRAVGQGDGVNRPAGRCLLHSVYNHPVTRAQAFIDDPEVSAPEPGLHVARDDRVAGTDDQHELPSQSLLHRALRNGERAILGEAGESHLDELARNQEKVRVLEQRPEFLGAGGGVDYGCHEVEPAGTREACPHRGASPQP